MLCLCICNDVRSVTNGPVFCVSRLYLCLTCITGCNVIKQLLELSAIVMNGV